jgi:hypothetical protein
VNRRRFAALVRRARLAVPLATADVAAEYVEYERHPLYAS